MPTFDKLRTNLRDEILVESDTGFYSPTGLFNMLLDASVEIASAGAFPLTTSTSTLISGSGSWSTPSDLLRVEIHGVTASGFNLIEAPFSEVKLYQAMSGRPRYYNFDPKRGGNILVGPKPPNNTSMTVEYVKDLLVGSNGLGVVVSDSDEPWNGIMPQFHDVVTLRAAMKAFEQGFEYGKSEYPKAEYWAQRFRGRLQAMAAFLGDESVLSLLVGPGQQQASQ